MDRARGKEILRRLFDCAVQAVRPESALPRYVSVDGGILRAGGTSYDLGKIGNVFLIGAGKASAFMAREISRMIEGRISSGCVNVKYGHGCEVPRCCVIECGHPVPDENGLAGAEQILHIAESAGEEDLVICVISGGGSALLPLPADGLSLADLRETNELLLKCGAEIHETNAVRKHLSRIKGGLLARTAYPARVLTLLISDVPGNDLDVIASGPTVADRSTYADAMAVVEKYGLSRKLPSVVVSHLRDGTAGKVAETPKPGDQVFAGVNNVIVADLDMALRAADEEARKMGFNSRVIRADLHVEAREAAKWFAGQVTGASGGGGNPPKCLISGGETTVKVVGRGKGGRNTEFALAAAIELKERPGWAILSCGTDGTDGPTDAAGAFCDPETIGRASALGLDAARYLTDNDSFTFFEKLDDLVFTGPTGTNVMDIQIALIS